MGTPIIGRVEAALNISMAVPIRPPTIRKCRSRTTKLNSHGAAATIYRLLMKQAMLSRPLLPHLVTIAGLRPRNRSCIGIATTKKAMI